MKQDFIFWAPRILSICFILFLALFSLDIFGMNLDFWGTLAGLFIHNIPAIILAIAVAISWRYEIIGGIAFILAGLLYVLMLLIQPFEIYKMCWILTIAGPAFLIGILFLIGWFRKK